MGALARSALPRFNADSITRQSEHPMAAIHPSSRPHRSRLIVTGAAGGIGTLIAGKLDHIADEVVRSDLADVTVTGNETSHPADLTDLDAVRALLKGGGDVVHLGGQSVEANFERVCNANLIGTYNLYEAARLEGVRRILFASSVHAIGFHTRETRLDAFSPTRPDTLYGVSKVYGEAMAAFYFDKFGIESLSLRIGTCIEKPRDERHLSTWLSPADFVRLVERMVRTPRLGNVIVYGASANRDGWWDNTETRFLGWEPQDTSEVFRDAVLPTERPDPEAPEVKYQGGVFCAYDHPGSTEAEAADT